MRCLLVLAAFMVLSTSVAIPQKMTEAVAPQQSTVLHGWLCHTCREIVADGENIGAAYNMQWLESAIDMRCKELLVIAHDCRKHFNRDKDTIDSKIKANEKNDYACVDIGYC